MKAAANFAANEKESRACLKEVNDVNTMPCMFDVLDANRDETFSLGEYSKLLQSYNTGRKLLQLIKFDRIDANHNGEIEVRELFGISDKFWFSIINTGRI